MQWDEDDDKWKKFSGIIKKMVTDSNAVAQVRITQVKRDKYIVGFIVCQTNRSIYRQVEVDR